MYLPLLGSKRSRQKRHGRSQTLLGRLSHLASGQYPQIAILSDSLENTSATPPPPPAQAFLSKVLQNAVCGYGNCQMRSSTLFLVVSGFSCKRPTKQVLMFPWMLGNWARGVGITASGASKVAKKLWSMFDAMLPLGGSKWLAIQVVTHCNRANSAKGNCEWASLVNYLCLGPASKGRHPHTPLTGVCFIWPYFPLRIEPVNPWVGSLVAGVLETSRKDKSI